MRSPYTVFIHITHWIEAYTEAKSMLFIPKLMVAMNFANRDGVVYNAIFSAVESILRISSPVLLGILLRSLLDPNTPAYYPYVIAIALGLISILQTFVHGLAFYFAYILGFTWRMSTVALVFDKLFRVKSEFLTSGTGKLVNLISNDVGRFDDWGVFAVFFWEAYLEVAAIFVILVLTISIFPALAAV